MRLLFLLSIQLVSLFIFISCLGFNAESNTDLSSSSPIANQAVQLDSMQFIVIIEGLSIDSISLEVHDDSSQILSLEKIIASVSDPQATILMGLQKGVEYTVSYKCFQNGTLIAQQLEVILLDVDLMFYSIPDKILAHLSLGEDRTLPIGKTFSFSFDVDDDSPLITMTFDYLGNGTFVENDRWVYESAGTYNAVVKVVDAFSTAFDTVVVIIVDPAVADLPSSNSSDHLSSLITEDQTSSASLSSESNVYSSINSSSGIMVSSSSVAAVSSALISSTASSSIGSPSSSGAVDEPSSSSNQIIPLTVNGSLSGDCGAITSITMTLNGNGISEQVGLIFLPSNKKYSGTIEMEIPNGQYQLEVMVYEGSQLTGYYSDFVQISTTIVEVPVFESKNAVPVIEAGANKTVQSSSIVDFNVSASDLHGSNLRYEWDFTADNGVDNFVEVSNGDTSFVLSTSYVKARVRVTDEDNNSVTDVVEVSELLLAVDSIFGYTSYLSWEKDLNSGFTCYNVFSSTVSSSFPSSADETICDRTTTHSSITGLTPGQKYYFKVSTGVESNVVESDAQTIWKSYGTMPQVIARDGGSIAAWNNSIILISSEYPNNKLDTIHKLNLATNTWQKITPSFNNSTPYAYGTVLGKIAGYYNENYAFNSVSNGNVYLYRTQSNTIDSIANFSSSTISSSTQVDSLVYFLEHSSNPQTGYTSNFLFKININSGDVNFINLNNSNIGKNYTNMVYCNNRIYFLEHRSSADEKIVEYYDFTHQSWNVDNVTIPASFEGSVCYDDKIYSLTLDGVEYYDTNAETFHNGTDMIISKTGYNVEYGGVIYNFGGYTGQTYSSEIEEYRPAVDR